ncbi:MAG: filamentous hemagglutinin N-terminal domain-containing protein [Candidatus Symbiobacter sp.]|nr:filamentous hemagglutinin N-terminal domain-containing protein [Candidatus Symbiobacter sp.]
MSRHVLPTNYSDIFSINQKIFAAKTQIQSKKTNPYRQLLTGSALGLVMALSLAPPQAKAAPTDGYVLLGRGVIATEGKTTNITQNSPRAVINWKSFDVAFDETVRFKTPDNGTSLNHIGGGQSQILGQVTSNGTLYFVNQNGFVFGAHSSVSAQNLVISTQSVDLARFWINSDENHQNYVRPADMAATISLQGKINVADRGVVAVFGPHVETTNTAVITSHQGSVVLAGGAVRDIDFGGDGLLSFSWGEGGNAAVASNGGNIRVPGGHVIVTARAAPSAMNALAENIGGIDTSSEAAHPDPQNCRIAPGRPGRVELTAENGLAWLRNGWINVGNNGTFIHRHNKPKTDIVIDQAFLYRINLAPGIKIELASDYSLFINGEIAGDAHSHLSLKASQGIILNRPVRAGGITASSLFFKATQPITVDQAGLSITTSGENWSPGGNNSLAINLNLGGDHRKTAITALNGGDIKLTTENFGRIYIHDRINAHNINANVKTGGIALIGAVTARNLDLHVFNRGDIWLEGSLTANNINLTTALGSINVLRKIVADNPDGLGGNVKAEISNGRRELRFHDTISATNVRARNLNGDITFEGFFISDDDSQKPNRIDVSGNGKVTFQSAVVMRKGGVFEVNIGNIAFNKIIADDANIAITLNNKGSYVTESLFNEPERKVSLIIGKDITFKHAVSAYFNVPGVIYITDRLDAQILSLTSGGFHAVLDGKIVAPANGCVRLFHQAEWLAETDFVYDEAMAKLMGGLDVGGANLTLMSDRNLVIGVPIQAAPGRNLTLGGKFISLNSEVSTQNGKLTLEYSNSDKKSPNIFDQNTYNHLKFRGLAQLEVRASGNLSVTGGDKIFDVVDFIAANGGNLSINSVITAHQHLGLKADHDVWLNQPVTTDASGELVEIVTPGNLKYLHYGKDGHVAW